MGSESYIFLSCLFFIFLLIPFIIPFNKWFVMFNIIFQIISIITMFKLVMLSTSNQFTYTTLLAIISFITFIFPFSLSTLIRFYYIYYQKKTTNCLPFSDFLVIVLLSLLIMLSFCCGFILTSFLLK